MNKITKFLNKIFAPTVTKTYYYNDKKVDKFPKEVEERMNDAFNSMEKAMEELRKSI